MALRDYDSDCSLCGQRLHEPVFSTAHFIDDETDHLWRYSDSGMHYDCYSKWEHRREFARRYFETWVDIFGRGRHWSVVYVDQDILLAFGERMGEFSLMFSSVGEDLRIKKGDWSHWVAGGWRDDSVHPLLATEIESRLDKLSSITVP